MATTNTTARSIASRIGVSLGLVIGAVIVANLLGLGATAGVADLAETWELVVSLLVTEAAFVVVALAFVPVHGLGIAATAASTTAALATVATLVVVSVAVGVAYARTDNLAIPVAIHAGYNAAAVVVGLAIAGL